MGTRLRMKNFDQLFARSTNVPIIVNDIFDTLESEKEALDKKMFVTYTDTDLLDTIPKCDCGKTFGQHYLGPNGETVICHHCNTPVQSPVDKTLEPLIWVRAPRAGNGTTIPLMNPQAYRFLNDFFSVNGNSSNSFSFIKYLINTDYRPNKVLHARWVDIIENLGIKRGLINFEKNFDEIIDKLSGLAQFNSTKDKREKLRDIRTFIKMYRDEIFCEHLPIHNRTIMVIENTKFGTYMDTTLKTLVEAVHNISGIDNVIKDFSVQQKENRVAKFIECLNTFGQNYERTFIAGKPGLVRKHVYATRCFFSFRAVINSLTGPHDHDELHLPWSLAVTTFHIHLVGKLMREHGYGYNEAAAFLNYHTYIHHPLIKQMFEEMIEQTPYKGVPCILGRNPSMYRTSIQRFFITKIKDDPRVMSISYPITVVSGPNADFDGDQMFGILALDAWTADELRYLAPHFGGWSLTKPRTVNENMAMPKPVVASAVSWIYDYPERARRPDPAKLDWMKRKFTIRSLNA